MLWTSGCCVFPYSLFLMGVLNCHLLVSPLPLSIGYVCVCVCVCVSVCLCERGRQDFSSEPQGAASRPQERSLLVGQSPNLKIETATRWNIRLNPSGWGNMSHDIYGIKGVSECWSGWRWGPWQRLLVVLHQPFSPHLTNRMSCLE